jgi:hypothetical protein
MVWRYSSDTKKVPRIAATERHASYVAAQIGQLVPVVVAHAAPATLIAVTLSSVGWTH